MQPAKGGSWALVVDREVLDQTTRLERRRQEAIYELIATEEAYATDLEAVDEVFTVAVGRFSLSTHSLPIGLSTTHAQDVTA